jgi:hypothetical protein
VSLVVNGALGVVKPVALSYAIVVHAALYFPITLWGLVEWWRHHLSLRQVRAAEAAIDDGAAGRLATAGLAPERVASVQRGDRPAD